MPDSQGVMRGLDADSCRAVTAAALGDVSKVKVVATTAQNRFTALQAGEIDVLSRVIDAHYPDQVEPTTLHGGTTLLRLRY